MAGRFGYGLFLAAVILLAVDAALGQGMQTFTSEQAAQRHCPAHAVVWLNTSSANYHFKGEPWYGHAICQKCSSWSCTCAHAVFVGLSFAGPHGQTGTA